MYITLHVKYPSFMSVCNETWIFLGRFSKKLSISNFIEIRPVGAEMLHADGGKDKRTDRHYEANSRFSQVCERA